MTVFSLVAALALAAPSARAADQVLTARVLVDVCLPYAQRSQSLEKAIRSARALDFRRPVGDQTPLEDWASEVDLVSNDGKWRLRIEEGQIDVDDRPAYVTTCSISSTRASARELGSLGRRAFGDERRWTRGENDAFAWSRLTGRPDEYRLEARVADEGEGLPALTIRGVYF